MPLQKPGGVAALICAATYLVGFALLVSLLAPLGYGSNDIDAAAVVAFIHAAPGLLIAWNTLIYGVNALALAVLVAAVAARLTVATPGWAAVGRAVGTMWATLVLGAGMVANVAAEQAARSYAESPDAAAEVWSLLHAVELGLGGGNEITGGAWLVCVNAGALRGQSLPPALCGLGILVGAAGIVTVIPVLGEIAGTGFGLGAILWYLALGWLLLAPAPDGPNPATNTAI